MKYLSIFVIASSFSIHSWADCSQIAIGSTRIQVATVPTRVASKTNFRLSIALKNAPTPAQSTFLDSCITVGGPCQSSDPSTYQTAPALTNCTTVAKGQAAYVRNDSGELSISPNGEWALRSSQKEIIAHGTLGKPDAKKKQLLIHAAVGDHFRAYGTGNPSNSEGGLTQTKGDASSGNGWAVLPYYWTKGYSAFAVTANDDKPASWKVTGSDVQWTFPGNSADLYLMPSPDLAAAARNYADLSGHAPMPPKWSFGYLQSRWGWGCGERACPQGFSSKEQLGRADIDAALKKFRAGHFPVDAFMFDFESFAAMEDFPGADYSLSCKGDSRYHDFVLSPKIFPQGAQQIASYLKDGIRVAIIRKPRLGNAADLVELRRHSPPLVNVCTDDNENDVSARRLHFDVKSVRDWYADRMQPLINDGIAGWWNDEGEEKYSSYYLWNQAEIAAEKQAAAKSGRVQSRHWSLGRAFSPGVQRLGAAAWTGDNKSNWEALRQTPVDLLDWSLSGMPYAAANVGGFHGPDIENASVQASYAELLTRWMQVGVFLPIFQAHSTDFTLPHFPWLAANLGKAPSPEAIDAIRKALNLRYRLLPYVYSSAYETYVSGLPIMRPLAMVEPHDAKAAAISDEWFLGSGLMAAPVQTQGGKRQIYFSERSQSFDGAPMTLAQAGSPPQTVFEAGQSYVVQAALDQVPAFVRAGTILTLASAAEDSMALPQTTDQITNGPLEVQIYSGKDASFTLYEDDGNSLAYATAGSGAYRKTKFTWAEASHLLSWQTEGTYDERVFKRMKVTLFDLDGHKTSMAASSLTTKGQVTVDDREPASAHAKSAKKK